MGDLDLLQIERLFSDFAWFADRGDAAALAELFASDGVLVLGGKESKGRQQIAADCQNRFITPQRKTRHVFSNLRVERTTPLAATTTAVQLTFEHLGESKPTRMRVNDVFDDLVKGADKTWRFSRREIKCELAFEI